VSKSAVYARGMAMVAEELIRHYLAQPYRISVARRDDDSPHPWLASVEELAGCEARGETAEEAVSRIPEALAEWVAGAHAVGREIPEPREARQYSGKLLVRMPQSLHAELARSAERDQVSLNAFITGVLAAAANWRQAPPGTGESGGDARGDRDAAQRQRVIMLAVTMNLVLGTIVALLLLVSVAS
jgi:predicted HicB family RNase H-like nuclease